MIQILIKGEEIDLFGDEKISVSKSLKKIQDIESTYVPYSDEFSVPATNKNNAIFRHFYRDDIIDGIPYAKNIPAVIMNEGEIYQQGYVSIQAASIKNGDPSSYKVQFYGKEVNIKDILGDLTLKDLEFSDYNHTYSDSNVLTGMETGLFSEDIIYPLASPIQRWEYDSASSNNNEYNIAYHSSDMGSHHHGVNWYELKPAIRFRAITDAIQLQFGLSFSGGIFLPNTDLDKLYMWLHTKEGYLNDEASRSLIQRWQFDAGTNYAAYSFFSTQGNYWKIGLPFSFGASTISIPTLYQVSVQFQVANFVAPFEYRIYRNNGQLLQTFLITGNGTYTTSGATYNSNILCTGSDLFYAEIHSQTAQSVNVTTLSFYAKDIKSTTSTLILTVNNATALPVGSNVVISELMPEMKIIDFMKSLINMFNQVVGTYDGLTYYFSNLEDYYAAGKRYNLNRYIDSGDIEITQPIRYKSIDLKYADSEQFQSKFFKDTIGREYGQHHESYSFDVSEEAKIEVGFEIPYMSVLNYESQGFPVFFCHKTATYDSTTGNSDSYYKNPIIFYVNGNIDLTSGNTIAFLDNTDTYTEIVSPYYFGTIDSLTLSGSRALLFSSDGINHPNELNHIPTDTQYTEYWQPTFERIFNPRIRLLSLEAILSPVMMNMLTTNDTIEFAGSVYFINSMETELTSGKTKFELITKI